MKMSEKKHSNFKPPFTSLLWHAIQHLGAMAFILGACLQATEDSLKALVLVECSIIVYRFFDWLVYFHDVTFKNNIRLFLGAVAPGAIACIIVAIIGIYIEEATIKDILELVTKILVGIFAIPMIIPFLPDDRWNDNFILRYRKLSSLQRILFKLSMYLYRVLVVAGLLLTLFAKPYCNDFYFESITIAGCAFWTFHVLIYLYCWRNCEIISEDTSGEPHSTPAPKNNDNGKGKMLYNSDVERLVQKIADRWSYKSDNLIWGKSEKINYKVSVEISAYTIIQYTINGRLDGVCDEDVSSALNFASYKMDDAAIAIRQETERELSKHNLPQSNYMITVYKGEISRR